MHVRYFDSHSAHLREQGMLPVPDGLDDDPSNEGIDAPEWIFKPAGA